MGMCAGKKVYFDKIDALVTANKRLQRGTNTNYLRAYQCPKCKFWHLTKTKVH